MPPEARGFCSLVAPIPVKLNSVDHPLADVRIRHGQEAQVVGVAKDGAPAGRFRCLLRFVDSSEIAVLSHWLVFTDGARGAFRGHGC